MSRQRLEQLSMAYSELTGSSYAESRKIILQTSTGKAIAEGRQAVLYEQHTANLYDIISELNLCESKKITTTMIQLSVEKILQSAPPASVCPNRYIKAAPAKKGKVKRCFRNRLLKLQKQQIQMNKQCANDMLSLRGILNADQHENQKW